MSFVDEKPSTRPLCVTVKRTGELTGLGHGAIYEAMNAGLLESIKIMGRRLIVYDSLERLILNRADDRPPSAFAENPRAHGRLKPSEAPPGPTPEVDPRLPSEKALAGAERAHKERRAARRSAERQAAHEAAIEAGILPRRRGRPRKTAIETPAEAL